MVDKPWDTKKTAYEWLIGRVMTDIVVYNDKAEVAFEMSDRRTYKVFHEHELCEEVYIEDIDGDLYDLIGSPLLLAESGFGDLELDHKEGTWTTYKFATKHGSVTVRWVGIDCGTCTEVVMLHQFL